MEHMTVKEAVSKALGCLKDIENSVSGNIGLAEDIVPQLTRAQDEVGRLFDRLPSHMLATNGSGYIPKKR